MGPYGMDDKSLIDLFAWIPLLYATKSVAGGNMSTQK